MAAKKVKRKSAIDKVPYNIRTIISDLKGTQYYLEKYLAEKNISLKYQDEIQEKVNQEIDQCEVCDTWDELGEMTQGHCDRCWDDAPENEDSEDRDPQSFDDHDYLGNYEED